MWRPDIRPITSGIAAGSIPLSTRVWRRFTNAAAFALSRTGVLIYQDRDDESRLVWSAFDPDVLTLSLQQLVRRRAYLFHVQAGVARGQVHRGPGDTLSPV